MAPQLSLARHLVPGLWENEAFHQAMKKWEQLASLHPPWLMKAPQGSELRGARLFLHPESYALGDVRRSNLRIVDGNIPESDLNDIPHLKLQEEYLFHSKNIQVSSSINF